MCHGYIAALLLEKSQSAESIAAHKAALSIREDFSRGDPTNDSKRLDVAKSESHIGQVYEQMAFRSGTSNQQRLALCSRGVAGATGAACAARPEKQVARERSQLSDRCGKNSSSMLGRDLWAVNLSTLCPPAE